MPRIAYRVMIIDDDRSILFLLEKMLENKGFKAITAEDAKKAILLLESEQVDLVMTDINMPEMDGLSFLRWIKEFKPHLPVVIMTADPNLPKVKLALQEGALDFLEKPFDLDKIFAAINRYASVRIMGRVVPLQDHHFLLISQNAKKPQQIHRALVATKANISVAKDFNDAEEIAKKQDIDLLVYDIGSKAPEHDFIQRIVEANPEMKMVYVAEKYDSLQLNQLMEAKHLDNIIFKNNFFSEAEFIVAVRKLFSNDIFGIEKYLAWGNEGVQYVTKHTDDRFKILESMSQYLKTLKINERFISRMLNVADEFLTNALYNAPVDEQGKALYHDIDRKIGRECTDREKSILTYVYDGNYFGISIQDHYGSVFKEDIFDGIKRCIQEQGNPSQKLGGAGLGLYLSFMTLNKFIINIKAGKKTEMIGLCNLRSSMKDFDLVDKSLSIFMEV